MTTTRIIGTAAILAAEADSSVVLCSYTDPTADVREGIGLDEARAIAREDASLVYADVALTSWRDVPLYWLGSHASLALTPAERIVALEEYRSTGGMGGVVMADPADYPDAEEGDEICHVGPDADEINWTGFDAAVRP